jgi:hypothetical protein
MIGASFLDLGSTCTREVRTECINYQKLAVLLNLIDINNSNLQAQVTPCGILS